MLPSSDKKEGPATCRLIVSGNQVGCVLGKGGSIIAEMRKLSGAFIVVLSKDKIPRGVPEHDEVIQVCFFVVVLYRRIVKLLKESIHTFTYFTSSYFWLTICELLFLDKRKL
jgi:hypothetical protein